MLLKGMIEEDFVNYKKPSMFLAFPTCTWKCEKENPDCKCQNSALSQSKNVFIDKEKIIERYLKNQITQAIVCGGLEPFDSFSDLIDFIQCLRSSYNNNDEVIIYTGYNEIEVKNKIQELKKMKNIIVKFGRFIPNEKNHYDKILGINLASNNQYARLIDEY